MDSSSVTVGHTQAQMWQPSVCSALLYSVIKLHGHTKRCYTELNNG